MMAQTWSGVKGCPVDAVTESVTTMDNDHNYIHQGKLFQASSYVTITAGGTYNYGFTTPAKKRIHYRPARIQCNADNLRIYFYQNAGFNGGTPIVPTNHFFDSPYTATMTISAAPTVTAAGTLAFQSAIFGSTGIGGARAGGESTAANEWVLSKSKQYVGQLANGSSASNTVIVQMTWYEEDGP